MSNTAGGTPRDILSITTAERCGVTINSELLRAEIYSSDYDDIEFGIDVHQDGPDLGIAAGTNWSSEDGPNLQTYHELTADQAREIAAALEEAADNAEEAASELDATDQDNQSFLRRLMP